MFELKEAIKLIHAGQAQPDPHRVRFYSPNVEGLFVVVKTFREALESAQIWLNPGFVPALRYWEIYVQAFLRAYFLACYHDLFLSLGAQLPRFTPSKVSHLLAQPFPKLILDAIRELIRPVVTPSLLYLVPDPNSFIKDLVFDEQAIIRNGAAMGKPDQGLLQFGIKWFPSLPMNFRSSFLCGTHSALDALNVVEGTVREGLEPAKYTAWIRTKRDLSSYKGISDALEREELKKIKAAKVDDDFSEVKAEKIYPFKTFEPIKVDYSTFGSGGSTGNWHSKDSRIQTGIMGKQSDFIQDSIVGDAILRPAYTTQYWCHDHDSVLDATRDFAMKILRPIQFYLADDVGQPGISIPVDFVPGELAHMGIVPFQQPQMYTVTQFHSSIIQLMKLDQRVEPVELYLNRWRGALSTNLHDWAFPSLGSVAVSKPSVPVPSISMGKKERKQRRPKKDKEKEDDDDVSMTHDDDKTKKVTKDRGASIPDKGGSMGKWKRKNRT